MENDLTHFTTDESYRLAMKLWYSLDIEDIEPLDFDRRETRRKVAFDLFREAAEEGNAEAMYELANCYFDSYPIPTDYAKTVEWLKKAADKGSDVAKAMLAYCYMLGKGVKADYKKGIDMFKACLNEAQSYDSEKQNEIHAFIAFEFSMISGELESKETSDACVKLTKNLTDEMISAKATDPASYVAIACYKMYSEKDFEGSMSYLKKCGDTDSIRGMQFYAAKNILIGDYYNFVKKDPEKAIQYYSKAASQFDAYSCEQLRQLMDGDDSPKNPSLSFKLASIAAEEGISSAQRAMGYYYMNFIGCDFDAEEAFKWTLKAAEQGDDVAQNNLGYHYSKGVGVEKDVKKAVEWLKKSAAQGNETAKAQLKKLRRWW
jgi:TPR repeat protein